MARNAARARDLFGEVPVTWPEVWAWLEAVPGIARDSWRARYYLENWDVPEKIRAAKEAGTLDRILSQRPTARDLCLSLALAHRDRVRREAPFNG